MGYKKISSKNKNFGENQKILNEIKKVKKLRNFSWARNWTQELLKKITCLLQ